MQCKILLYFDLWSLLAELFYGGKSTFESEDLLWDSEGPAAQPPPAQDKYNRILYWLTLVVICGITRGIICEGGSSYHSLSHSAFINGPYMSRICAVWNAGFHFGWGRQQHNFLCEGQRRTERFFLFHVIQNSAGNQQQDTKHSMRTNRRLTEINYIPLNAQGFHESWLQWGLILSVLQLLSQLLIRQPELLWKEPNLSLSYWIKLI